MNNQYKKKPEQAATTNSPSFLMQTNLGFTPSLFLTACFFAIIAFGLFHHEMWRDELQAWLLARDSNSLAHLFSNLRYDGHPGLWHTLLFFVTRFTHNPAFTQVLHAVLATGFGFVFIRYAEIKTLYKIMFLLGYLPLYEYSVVSRCYALSLFLIFLFCALYKKRESRYLLIGVCLAFLANSNVYGAIMAIGLSGILFLDFFAMQQSASRKWLQFIGGLLIAAIGILFAVYQIFPKSGNSFPVDYPNGLLDSTRWLSSLSHIFTSYLYVPSTEDLHFWNTSYYFENKVIIDDSLWVWLEDHHEYLMGWLYLPIFLVLLSTILFLRKKLILLLYLVLTFTLVAFSYYTNLSFMRYSGFLWISFIVCYWLSMYYPTNEYKNGLLNKLKALGAKIEKPYLMILFSVNIIGSIIAYQNDYENDFTTSKIAADFLKENKLDSLPYIGSVDYVISPIAAYLNKKIYYPEMRTEGSFCIWSSQRRSAIDKSDFTSAADSMIAKGVSKIVLIISTPFYYSSAQEQNKLVVDSRFSDHCHLHLEKIIASGIVNDESYAIYTLTKDELPIAQ